MEGVSQRSLNQVDLRLSRSKISLNAVAIGIGLLLFAASFLKMAELTESIITNGRVNSFQLLLLGVAAVEFLLGFAWWFFSGRRAVIAATIMLFVSFLIANLVFFVQGQSHCGCFGYISVPISYSTFLSILVLSLLFVNYRDLSTAVPIADSFNDRLFHFAIFTGAVFPFISICILAGFSPSALAHFAGFLGQALQTEKSDLSLFYMPDQDQTVKLAVGLLNRSSTAKRIVGYAVTGANCNGAFHVEGLPIQVPPFERLEITIVFRANKVNDPAYWTNLASLLETSPEFLAQESSFGVLLIPETAQTFPLIVPVTMKLDEMTVVRHFKN